MSAASAKPASNDTQIHSDNIELSVYSCWTGKRLLRAKLADMKIDPKGKFVSIDIDDDESAKPEFALETPLAAERTALKELQMRIKEIRDGNGSWAEKFGLIDEVILDAQERAGAKAT
nr:hypothetical protein [Ferrimicrobium acidiphilum]